ncbi:MAG: putative porin [Flavobacteriales bacterium AspAUS03]
MKQRSFLYPFFFLYCLSLISIAQDTKSGKGAKEEENKPDKEKDGKKEKVKSDKEQNTLQIYNPTPEDYYYWKEGQAPQCFNNKLSINTYYDHNYRQKDNFGLLPFPNIGQPFNPLVYHPRISLIPDMGFSTKLYNYFPDKEIRYFDVKTPTTQFFYESGMFLGQMLQFLFTHSPSKQFNYSLQYRGLRSTGRYARQLASNNFFLSTINYLTRDQHYKVWAHYIRQDINNEENGGLKDIENFQKNKTSNRFTQSIAVRLNSADSQFGIQRWYLGQSLGLFTIHKNDSTIYKPLLFTHRLQYETKKYLYQENQVEDFFGVAYPNEARKDQSDYTHFKNKLTVSLDFNKKLWIEAGVAYDKVSYKFPAGGINVASIVPQKIRENILSAIGNTHYQYSDLVLLKGEGRYTLGKKSGNAFTLNAQAEVRLFQEFQVGGQFAINTVPPTFNTIAYRSFYKDYNYYNPNFKKIKTQSIHLYLLSDQYINLYFNIYNVGHYTYFAPDGKPEQYNKNLNLFDIRAQTIFKFWKLRLDNTLQYQKVNSGKEVLPFPTFILRNSLYYEDQLFDRNLFVQTGVTLNYFSQFKSRAFFPVLNEFTLTPLQDGVLRQSIGGYPFLDYFLNFEVYRMKFYLRFQHFNSIFMGNDYFVVPGYPSTGPIIQAGILWNLFT